MRSNDSSTLFTAVDAREPLLNWEEIVAMTKVVPLVVLTFGADLCASNNRVTYKFIDLAFQHNAKVVEGSDVGFLAILDTSCGKHIMHRVADSTFKFDKLLPNMFATSWCCRQPKTQLKLLTALRVVVKEDLHNNFFVGLRPPLTHQRHTKFLLDITVKRHFFTRARSALADGLPHDYDEIVAFCEEFSNFFEGPSKHHKQHFAQFIKNPTAAFSF